MQNQTPRNAGRLYALAYLDLGQFLNISPGNLGETVDQLGKWREMLGAHVRLAVVRLPRGAQLGGDGVLIADWKLSRAQQFAFRADETALARFEMRRRRDARTVATLEKVITLRQRILQRIARRAEDEAQAAHDAARMAAGLTPWAAQGWR